MDSMMDLGCLSILELATQHVTGDTVLVKLRAAKAGHTGFNVVKERAQPTNNASGSVDIVPEMNDRVGAASRGLADPAGLLDQRCLIGQLLEQGQQRVVGPQHPGVEHGDLAAGRAPGRRLRRHGDHAPRAKGVEIGTRKVPWQSALGIRRFKRLQTDGAFQTFA